MKKEKWAGVLVKELGTHADERGWLAEAWRGDEPGGRRPAMAYVSFTRCGVRRGPHEHRRQTDRFVFLGAFRLLLWDNRPGSLSYGARRAFTFFPEGVPTLAVVPPGVVHAYECLQEGGGFVVNLPDKLYRGRGKRSEPDETRHEDDPGGRFR